MADVSPGRPRRPGLVIGLSLLAALLVVAGSLAWGWGSDFGGADAAVTSSLEEAGHEPWFAPVFSPGSSELESGLFAVQAAIGAGVLGFVLGTLRERRRNARPDARRDAESR